MYKDTRIYKDSLHIGMDLYIRIPVYKRIPQYIRIPLYIRIPYVSGCPYIGIPLYRRIPQCIRIPLYKDPLYIGMPLYIRIPLYRRIPQYIRLSLYIEIPTRSTANANPVRACLFAIVPCWRILFVVYQKRTPSLVCGITTYPRSFGEVSALPEHSGVLEQIEQRATAIRRISVRWIPTSRAVDV